jgi:hypothetical protein
VTVLAAFDGLDDSFVADAQHETPEGKVNGRGTGFPVNVRVNSVELLILMAKLLVEDVLDEGLVVKVLVNVLLELAVGAGMGVVIEHWSVGRVC